MKEIISYGRFRCPELAPHKNRGMEITYIEKGMLEWMVEGVVERVEPGSIFFTLPWQVHGSVNPKEPDNVIWHVLFHLKDDYPQPHKRFGFAESLGFSPSETRTLSAALASSRRHGFPASPTMCRLMPALIGELQSSHELREAQVVSLLRMVLVELKRVVCGETVHEETPTASEPAVRKLVEMLSSHCDQSWTLAQMADQCGIRRTRLNTVFQKLTGSTPMEYLGRLRMERAKTLLRETDIKIIDIAFECGFNSSQYFANTFKHATGMTPSEYRTHSAKLTAAEMQTWRNVEFRSEQEERKRVATFTSGEPGAATAQP
jgi:AraC family L-rhamnose operon regulatory protein RhaS